LIVKKTSDLDQQQWADLIRMFGYLPELRTLWCFAGEVRALLASRSAEGIFWDWPGDTEVIMARKPG